MKISEGFVDMGGGGRRVPLYGPFSSAQAALQRVGSSIFKSAIQQGALSVLAAALPQFAPLLFAGYAAYQGYREFRDLKSSYDEMHGPKEEKLLRLAASEGIKVFAGQVAGNVFDRPIEQTIQLAVHDTTDFMTQKGVFDDVSKHAGFPQFSDDLRYFFMTTAENSLKGAYSGAKDEIASYITKEVLP
jgi:hypothetical protein